MTMQKINDCYIADDFERCDSDAVYELHDGSKWKLVSYIYSYTYKYRPRARVWRDDGRYYLEIDGVREKIEVREI